MREKQSSEKKRLDFNASSEKAEFVANGFTEIAEVYDTFNDAVTFGAHRLWKRSVVREALRDNPGSLLDACCGSGDIALALRKKTSGRSTPPDITAADFSETMLRIAKRKQNGAFPVKFVHTDILNNPFGGNRFDAVTVGFGLRNLTDYRAGLTEFNRLLKPGGRLVILDMGKIKQPLIDWMYRRYFFYVVPIVGKILNGKTGMFEYFPQSTVNYPDASALSKMLAESGFCNIGVIRYMFGSVTIHSCVKSSRRID